MRVDGRGCCCELVCEALAQQNCAGVAEAHDAIGVSGGNVIAKKTGTVRRANVRRLDDVFGAIRDPMQGAAQPARDEVRLRRFGFLPCVLCGYGQISTKRRVQRRNSLQVRIYNLDRRQFASTVMLHQFVDTEIAQRFAIHAGSFFYAAERDAANETALEE